MSVSYVEAWPIAFAARKPLKTHESLQNNNFAQKRSEVKLAGLGAGLQEMKTERTCFEL
jgi:hypothetical protein